MTYYDILEISVTADFATIEGAYRRLQIKYHPDKNLDNPDYARVQFIRATEAYETLIDPNKRSRYNSLLNIRQTRTKSIKPEKVYRPDDFQVLLARAPYYDLWGNKMTEEQRLEWAKNNSTDITELYGKEPPIHKYRKPQKPPTQFDKEFDKKSEWAYYDKLDMPNIRKNRG